MKIDVLELTDEMKKRNDKVCNSVHECLKVLLDEPNLELDKDMIEDVIEEMESALNKYDKHICDPFIVSYTYGEDCYCSISECGRETCKLHHNK